MLACAQVAPPFHRTRHGGLCLLLAAVQVGLRLAEQLDVRGHGLVEAALAARVLKVHGRTLGGLLGSAELLVITRAEVFTRLEQPALGLRRHHVGQRLVGYRVHQFLTRVGLVLLEGLLADYGVMRLAPLELAKAEALRGEALARRLRRVVRVRVREHVDGESVARAPQRLVGLLGQLGYGAQAVHLGGVALDRVDELLAALALVLQQRLVSAQIRLRVALVAKQDLALLDAQRAAQALSAALLAHLGGGVLQRNLLLHRRHVARVLLRLPTFLGVVDLAL